MSNIILNSKLDIISPHISEFWF